jgi:hypothetical protein
MRGSVFGALSTSLQQYLNLKNHHLVSWSLWSEQGHIPYLMALLSDASKE